MVSLYEGHESLIAFRLAHSFQLLFAQAGPTRLGTGCDLVCCSVRSEDAVRPAKILRPAAHAGKDHLRLAAFLGSLERILNQGLAADALPIQGIVDRSHRGPDSWIDARLNPHIGGKNAPAAHTRRRPLH